MKKTLSILLASALAMTSVSAQAGVYFGLRGGYNNIEVENTSADIEEGEGDWLASGYIGFRASDFFRFDVEGMFNPERSFEGGALKRLLIRLWEICTCSLTFVQSLCRMLSEAPAWPFIKSKRPDKNQKIRKVLLGMPVSV